MDLRRKQGSTTALLDRDRMRQSSLAGQTTLPLDQPSAPAQVTRFFASGREAMPFQVVEVQRLYQQVADQIGGLIRSGEFRSGDRLPPERELARKLGVSRPVVREAMIALEIAGFVEVRGGAGTFVQSARPASNHALAALSDPGPSPFDLIAARQMLEGEIAFTPPGHVP